MSIKRRRRPPSPKRPSARRRKPDTSSEDWHQRETAKVLDALGAAWCHVPNGLATTAPQAASAKAQGLKAGIPDVLIFSGPPVTTCGPRALGYAIELKRPDKRPKTLADPWQSSCVSAAQRAWRTRLEACGWRVSLCFGVGDVVEQLRAWGWGV